MQQERRGESEMAKGMNSGGLVDKCIHCVLDCIINVLSLKCLIVGYLRINDFPKKK